MHKRFSYNDWNTNDELNRKVLNYNPTIKRARLPGPMQLRENFESNDKYSTC